MEANKWNINNNLIKIKKKMIFLIVVNLEILKIW
jgi:hypothetical protein